MLKHISNIIFTVSLILAGLILANRFLGARAAHVYIVTSGSMEPAIHVGSVALVLPQSNYQENDIVTFKSGPKTTTTHRILHKSYPEGTDLQPVFYTGGDANSAFDTSQLLPDSIVGKVVFLIPYLGIAINYAKTPQGFILLVIVPATIIIYEELKSLLTFPSQLLKKLSPTPKPLIIVPVVGAMFVLVSLTGAYFYDHEISVENTISIAVPTPTPTPIP